MTKTYAKSFKDLLVYQEAREAIFSLSKSFPKQKAESFCGLSGGVLHEPEGAYFGALPMTEHRSPMTSPPSSPTT